MSATFLFSRIRSVFTRCSRHVVTACQSAIKGILRNMSLLKTKLPGLLPNVEYVPARIACIVIANASSMKSFAHAPVNCCGGCPCSSVLKTFPTVWCMRLHIALVCGFCWWLEHLWFDNLLIRVGTLVQWIRLHYHGYSELATDIMSARLVHISWKCEPKF